MKKGILSKLFVGVILVTMIATLGACGKKTDDKSANASTKEETKLDKIKKSGKLVIGTSADYPPYEFHKQTNGKDEIVGFDIMIADKIAKDLGVQLEIKDMAFNGLLAALNGDKVDMIVAGMNPTPERAKSVDFSKVYYQAVQAIVVRAEDNDKYKTLDSLKGKKVGVQISTTQEELAKKQIAGAEVKSLGKITDLVLELKYKKVDAIVVELPVATSYVDKNKDLAVSDMKFDAATQTKGAAVAIKKNSPEFVNAVNKTLDQLMNDKSIEKFVIDATNQVE
jgi:ABC-type amino acid transport/signal transduction systems, periplasmic component/domain